MFWDKVFFHLKGLNSNKTGDKDPLFEHS